MSTETFIGDGGSAGIEGWGGVYLGDGGSNGVDGGTRV